MFNVYPHLWFFLPNSSPIFLHADHLHLGISLASQIRTITTIIFPSITSLPVYHSHLGLNPRVSRLKCSPLCLWLPNNTCSSIWTWDCFMNGHVIQPRCRSWKGSQPEGKGSGSGKHFPFLKKISLLLCILWLQDMIPGTVITILLFVRKWCQHPRHQSRYGKNLYFDDGIKLLFLIFQISRLLYLVIPKFVRYRISLLLKPF